jgi:hypothetical protein
VTQGNNCFHQYGLRDSGSGSGEKKKQVGIDGIVEEEKKDNSLPQGGVIQ